MSVESSGRRAASRARRAAGAVAFCAALAAGGSAESAATSDSTPHESYFYTSCEGTPCQRQMYRVPDDRRLKVRSLSCAAQMRSPGAVSHIGLKRGLNGGGEEVTDFAANRVGVQDNTHYYAFRAGPDAIVEGGDTVDAFVESTGEIGVFYCFLAGDLIEAR